MDAGTKQILGAAILGTGGDEAIHGLLDAVNTGLPYGVLQRAVPIHPTVSELIPGPVAELVGIRVGVVSGVINLESSGVEASDWRLRHEAIYHEA